MIGISTYTRPVTLYQLQPHAHMCARDFTYIAIYPEGREEVLLTVPAYDFHWQLAYQLERPLRLPPGSKLIVKAHYDNSKKNYDERIRADDPAGNCGPENWPTFAARIKVGRRCSARSRSTPYPPPGRRLMRTHRASYG